MNRTLIRWSMCAALSDFGRETGPWPTLVGPNVYDSRIDPVEETGANKMLPILAVYTDYERDHWMHGTLNRKDRLVTLTLEMMVAQITKDEDGIFSLAMPQSDSEIEFALDTLELQVSDVLRNEAHPAVACFKRLTHSVETVASRRAAQIDAGQRLGARQITLELCIHRDQITGNMPQEVDAFLTRMEAWDVYADRATELREIYTSRLVPAGQAVGVANTWPLTVRNFLGSGATGPGLPANVQWIGLP